MHCLVGRVGRSRRLVRFARIQWGGNAGAISGSGTNLARGSVGSKAWFGFPGQLLQIPASERPPLLTCEHLVAMLASDGQTRNCWSAPAGGQARPAALGGGAPCRYAVHYPGIRTTAGTVRATHPSLVRKAPGSERVYVLNSCGKCECDPELFLPELIEFAKKTGPARPCEKPLSSSGPHQRVRTGGAGARRPRGRHCPACARVSVAGQVLCPGSGRLSARSRRSACRWWRARLWKGLDCAAEPNHVRSRFRRPSSNERSAVPSGGVRHSPVAAVQSRRCVDLGRPDMQLSVDGVSG